MIKLVCLFLFLGCVRPLVRAKSMILLTNYFFSSKKHMFEMIKFSFKHPLYTKYHLPNGRKSQKTDFGHFAFGHVGTIKKFFQMGLNWFFRPKISLGTIKYTSGLYKKQTFVSRPTCPKWPLFKKVHRFGNVLTQQCILTKKCTLEMSSIWKTAYVGVVFRLGHGHQGL